MAHYLGKFFEYLAAFLLFAFSCTLGFKFFSDIAPASMPWFTPAAMGLTEFGLLCWLAVFMLTHHHDAKKTIAFLMVFACVLAVLTTDAAELSILFGSQYRGIDIAGWVFYVLIFLFGCHLLAFVSNFFVSYFTVYPFKSPLSGKNNSHVGKIIPNLGNLIPTSQYSIQELEAMRDSITGYITAVKESPQDDPLAVRQLPRPQPQEEGMTLAQMGKALREGVSGLRRKKKGDTKSGSQVAPVPGNQSEITSASGLTDATPHD